MPQLQEPRAIRIKRRVLSLVIGSLLVAAIVLNSTALTKKAWMQEKTSPIVTTYPVELLDLSMARRFTRENLSPTSPKGYAVYTGMRAGVYQICFTLANVTSEPAVLTEICHSYRDLTYHRVFQRDATRPGDESSSNNSFYTYAVSMCDLLDTRVVSFPDFGIPSDSLLPEFLDVFCGAPGQTVAIFQIVAIVSTSFCACLWLCTLCASSKKVALLRAVMFVASAGFLLTLITCIMWIGAFQHSVKDNGHGTLVQGESARCTIAAAVLLFAAALLAKLSARSYVYAYDAQNSANVPLV